VPWHDNRLVQSERLEERSGAERALALVAAESVLFPSSVGRNLITGLRSTRTRCPTLSGTVAVQIVFARLRRLEEARAEQHVGALLLSVASASILRQISELRTNLQL
jgi:ABC-type sugar transport system ATPase subunit